MPVQLWLYIPVDVDVNDSNYEFPSMDNHAVKFAEVLNDPSLVAEEDDNQNQNRYNQQTPEMKALSKFHKKQSGWVGILAWSHGVSSRPTKYSPGGVQDWSMTKYNDALSPQFTIMALKKETIPRCLLRCIYVPADGKVTVLETELNHVKITSVSTGGSGGEDRLTENMTLEAKSFTFKNIVVDTVTGDKTSESFGSWDEIQKKGARGGLSAQPKTLAQLAKDNVISNKDEMTKTVLQQVQNMKLITAHELDVEPLPEKGRMLVVSNSDMKTFKEVFLKNLTLDALRAVVAEKLKTDVSKIKSLFSLDEKSRLIEIEDDEKVLSFEEGDEVVYELVPEPVKA